MWKERLLEDLKAAMKDKNVVKKNTVQMVRAAILQVEKDKQIELNDADSIVFVIPRRLQEFIDKHYISLNEANWISKLYREEFKLKEAKSGFSLY